MTVLELDDRDGVVVESNHISMCAPLILVNRNRNSVTLPPIMAINGQRPECVSLFPSFDFDERFCCRAFLLFPDFAVRAASAWGSECIQTKAHCLCTYCLTDCAHTMKTMPFLQACATTKVHILCDQWIRNNFILNEKSKSESNETIRLPNSLIWICCITFAPDTIFDVDGRSFAVMDKFDEIIYILLYFFSLRWKRDYEENYPPVL